MKNWIHSRFINEINKLTTEEREMGSKQKQLHCANILKKLKPKLKMNKRKLDHTIKLSNEKILHQKKLAKEAL